MAERKRPRRTRERILATSLELFNRFGEPHVTTADIAANGVYERWQPGTHLLLVASVDPDALPDWQFTAAQFDAFGRALVPAEALSCPYGPPA